MSAITGVPPSKKNKAPANSNCWASSIHSVKYEVACNHTQKHTSKKKRMKILLGSIESTVQLKYEYNIDYQS